MLVLRRVLIVDTYFFRLVVGVFHHIVTTVVGVTAFCIPLNTTQMCFDYSPTSKNKIIFRNRQKLRFNKINYIYLLYSGNKWVITFPETNIARENRPLLETTIFRCFCC